MVLATDHLVVILTARVHGIGCGILIELVEPEPKAGLEDEETPLVGWIAEVDERDALDLLEVRAVDEDVEGRRTERPDLRPGSAAVRSEYSVEIELGTEGQRPLVDQRRYWLRDLLWRIAPCRISVLRVITLGLPGLLGLQSPSDWFLHESRIEDEVQVQTVLDARLRYRHGLIFDLEPLQNALGDVVGFGAQGSAIGR